MSTLVFLNIPAHGHVNPTLAVVEELVARGHRVLYFCTEEFRQKIEVTGAEFKPYQMPTHLEKVDPGNFIAVARLLLELTDPMVENHLSEIKKIKPDLLVHDSLCPWGKIIAHELKVKAVCSMSTLVMSEKLLLKTPQMIFSVLKRFLSSESYRLKRMAKDLFKKYGIYFSFRDVFNNLESLNIVYTSRYFQPFSKKIEGHFEFVGPSIPKGNKSTKVDFPWASLNSKKIILISLGTLLNDHPEFYRICVEALQGMKYTVILAVGNEENVKKIGPLPRHFIAKAHVPQVEILKKTSLFISHGGMNSVNESLYFGVPLILVPQQKEQLIVARRVEELGAGVILKNKKDAEVIKNKVDEVLKKSKFKTNAQKISKTLKEAGGYGRAVELLEKELNRP